MESKGNVESKGIGLKGALGHKRESYFVKTIDSKLEEIRELKELVEKSEKLQEFYQSVFKLEGLELESQSINRRYKTAKMFSPKSDEVKSLESLEELLGKFKEEYTNLAGDISKTLEKYNNNNKKALDLFKIKNEQLINKIEQLNSE